MVDAALIQLEFDYGKHEISATDAKPLEKHAKIICETQDRVRRTTAEGVLRIGKELSAARDRLANHGNGTFGAWCKERCGISSRTAERAIAAYAQFKDCDTVSQSFDATSLYLLSADSCPEDVRDDFIERAEKGETITAAKVKETLGADREEPSYEDRLDSLMNKIRTLANNDQRCILIARLRNICEELQENGS